MKKTSMSQPSRLIRDRIKELRRVQASLLVPNPKNWRIHGKQQAAALKGLLSEVDYADAFGHRSVLTSTRPRASRDMGRSPRLGLDPVDHRYVAAQIARFASLLGSRPARLEPLALGDVCEASAY